MTVSEAYEKMMSKGKIPKVNMEVEMDERRRTMGPGIGADPEMRLKELERRVDKLESIIKKLG
jgi:hypothetical protein